MGLINAETAVAIAVAYQEIARGEKLLEDVRKAMGQRETRWPDAEADLSDVFGRRIRSLELGVPSGSNGHRICHLSYDLAVPIIEAHIGNKRAELHALCIKAGSELNQPRGLSAGKAPDSAEGKGESDV